MSEAATRDRPAAETAADDDMRLCLVMPSLGPGGGERVTSVLANAWAHAGKRVSILTLSGPEAAPYFPLEAAVEWVPLGLARPSRHRFEGALANLRRVRALRAALRARRPHAVVAFGEQTNALAVLAARGLGAATILTEWIHPAAHPVGRVWALACRHLYPRADAVVVQSPGLAAVQGRSPRSRTVVIPNPVWPGAAAAEARRRRPHGAGGTVVAIGRLVDQKGFDLLLRAFARAAVTRPGWRLDIRGEGPRRGDLEALAAELGVAGRVRLSGLADDVAGVLAAADLFALPSRYEGLPNALCEALAAGLPAVAFDCPGAVGEIVRHEVDGLLVPPEDVAGFAAALGRLMDEPATRARMAAAAPDIAERHSLTAVLARWEALFAEALAGRRARA